MVSSGYSNDPVMADYREHGFLGVVGKPYHIEELSMVRSNVMKAGATGKKTAKALPASVTRTNDRPARSISTM